MYPISWLGSEPKFQPLFTGEIQRQFCFQSVAVQICVIYTPKGTSLGDGWRITSEARFASFTCRLRSNPHVLNLSEPRSSYTTLQNHASAPFLTTVSLTLSNALGSLVSPPRQKTWDLNSPALPWTYCRSVFIWGHVAGGQRDDGEVGDSKPIPRFWNHSSYDERRSTRPVSTATVPPQDSLGPVSGRECSKNKKVVHTHPEPQIPLLYSLCPKMESHPRSSFHLHLCRPDLRVTWGPASLYLMKNKWKLTACFIGALKSGLLPQSACCYF